MSTRSAYGSSEGVSRRVLLLGACAGAGSLGLAGGGRAWAAGVAAPSDGSSAPDLAASEAIVGAALPPRVPGLQYAAYSQYDFQPQLSQNGRTNSSMGSYCTNPTGLTTNLIAPLHLPDGALLRSVEYTVYNSYTAQSAYLAYRPHDGTLGKDAWVEVPMVPGGLQARVLTPAPAWLLDNTAGAYFLWIPTGVGSGWQVSVWSARVAYTPPSLALLALAKPERVYDSRVSGGKLLAGQSRKISVAKTLNGADLVPPGAGAVTFNLTVTQTEGAGWLSVFPSNVSWPGTSSINWYEPGQTLANSGTMTLPADRSLTVLAGGYGGTHFVVDVTGIYS